MVSDLPPARLLEVTPSEYHRLPGFSASLAKILIGRSAAHAVDAHARRIEQIAAEDESDGEEDDKVKEQKQTQLDRGNILHALVLGKGGERIEIIPTDLLSGKNLSYSSAAAKDARDAARKAGKIPVKEPKMAGYLATAGAIKERISSAGHVLDGQSEFAVEWHEATPHRPVRCKGMMDHVDLEVFGGLYPGAVIYDLKIVADAHPERCMRNAEGFGYALQAAAYTRALGALFPKLRGRIDFRLLFVEPYRPYAMWDPERMSGAFRELGERRWLRAVHTWAEIQATGKTQTYREMGHDEITAPMWTLRNEGFTPEDM
jgi:hypothetical protein